MPKFEDGSIGTHLIAAKTRLVPLMALSIPHLELTGAVIGLWFTKQVCEALRVQQNKATYWVDSCNVGCWIHSQSWNFKPFVVHRVGEIREDSNTNQWRYVPGKLNSADYGTRGLTIEESTDNECWWQGPAFLSQANDNWPDWRFTGSAETIKELKAEVSEWTNCSQQDMLNSFSTSNQGENEWRLEPTHFSKWYRTKPANKLEFVISVVQVWSWVHRFIS